MPQGLCSAPPLCSQLLCSSDPFPHCLQAFPQGLLGASQPHHFQTRPAPSASPPSLFLVCVSYATAPTPAAAPRPELPSSMGATWVLFCVFSSCTEGSPEASCWLHAASLRSNGDTHLALRLALGPLRRPHLGIPIVGLVEWPRHLLSTRPGNYPGLGRPRTHYTQARAWVEGVTSQVHCGCGCSRCGSEHSLSRETHNAQGFDSRCPTLPAPWVPQRSVL